MEDVRVGQQVRLMYSRARGIVREIDQAARTQGRKPHRHPASTVHGPRGASPESASVMPSPCKSLPVRRFVVDGTGCINSPEGCSSIQRRTWGVPQLDTTGANRGYRRSHRDGGPQAAPLGRPVRDRMCSLGRYDVTNGKG
jgi:hypothetical protein